MKLNIKYTYYPIEIDGQLNEKYFNCVLFLLLNSMNDVLFVEQQQQQIAPNSEIYNKNPHGSHANYLLELNCNILLFIAFRFFFSSLFLAAFIREMQCVPNQCARTENYN